MRCESKAEIGDKSYHETARFCGFGRWTALRNVECCTKLHDLVTDGFEQRDTTSFMTILEACGALTWEACSLNDIHRFALFLHCFSV
jgi:hypothetical protein